MYSRTGDRSQYGLRAFSCWIRKATNKFSEYVTLTDFPLLQWLHERPSTLRYTHSACLVTTARHFSFSKLTVMTLLAQGQDKPGTISAPAWDPNHSGRPRRGGFYFIFCVYILCVKILQWAIYAFWSGLLLGGVAIFISASGPEMF
jgi:hypothetical protein